VTDPDPYDLHRFLAAQDGIFDAALAELRAGSKQSHWMWFIFPQLAGLGQSAMAKDYGISSIEEARAYLDHPLLGARLRECVETLLPWAGKRSPEQILGPIDAVKLRSCLTLFDRVEPEGLFTRALVAFYAGMGDPKTLELLDLD
jgi:uncharacterized protein (DUF1810 family)